MTSPVRSPTPHDTQPLSPSDMSLSPPHFSDQPYSLRHQSSSFGLVPCSQELLRFQNGSQPPLVPNCSKVMKPRERNLWNLTGPFAGRVPFTPEPFSLQASQATAPLNLKGQVTHLPRQGVLKPPLSFIRSKTAPAVLCYK